MNAYIRETVGADVATTMVAYEEGGVKYDNFKLVLMGYLTY
jgi:hypothetical protein